MSAARVVVVVNKWWEFDPVMNVLLHDNARPKDLLPWPGTLRHPRARPNQTALPRENMNPLPRAVYRFPRVEIEMWCISDLLEHLKDEGRWQSSSQRKAEQLPKIFSSGPADLVIALGTAAYLGDTLQNGSVVIGTKVFSHNCHPGGTNRDSNWEVGPFDVVLESALSRDAFAGITNLSASETDEALKRFTAPPLSPANPPAVLAEYDGVALGVINVTDSAEYGQTDVDTKDAFDAHCPSALARSLETTHGLIRVFGGDPFMFVSGITDRFRHYKDDVFPREYAQNTAASHNAGVVLAWMLPKIAVVLGL